MPRHPAQASEHTELVHAVYAQLRVTADLPNLTYQSQSQLFVVLTQMPTFFSKFLNKQALPGDVEMAFRVWATNTEFFPIYSFSVLRHPYVSHCGFVRISVAVTF